MYRRRGAAGPGGVRAAFVGLGGGLAECGVVRGVTPRAAPRVMGRHFVLVGARNARRSAVRRPPCMCAPAGPAKKAADAAGGERPRISMVMCDVDGTLLSAEHDVEPHVADSIRDATRRGVKFFCATGKSRLGAINSIGDLGDHLHELYDGHMPGVYLQGLVVYGIHGELVYERTMTEETCRKIVATAREMDVTLIAYNGDRILCEEENEQTNKLRAYKEPPAVPIGRWEDVIGKVALHKLIFLAPVERVKVLRPLLDAMAGDEVTITQAMPDMIEVLPPKASKGDGVRRLLESLGSGTEQLMAIGDAENDVEMLKLARVGVAMGNGLPAVKDVADYITASNNEGGVAQALERYVLHSEGAQAA